MYKRLNSTGTLIQRTTTEAPQGHMYYIGLDVHKKTIRYCVKDVSGQVHREGQIGATRRELDGWMKTLPPPWMVAMEATIFTGWIYDHLLPHAQQVKVAHPLMLRAIAAAKKKNDRIDAGKIVDCLHCDFLPECHMASTAIRDRRRTLRYRHLLVRQMVQMKNRISGLLMETGVSYNKQRLHKVGKERAMQYSPFGISEPQGDDAENPHYIETVPRKGYRFLGPVVRAESSDSPKIADLKRVALEQDVGSRPTPALPGQEHAVRIGRNWKFAIAAGLVAIALTSVWYFSRHSRALTEKDTIVLADFDNKTGDAVLGLRARDCRTGDVLAEQQVQADKKHGNNIQSSK